MDGHKRSKSSVKTLLQRVSSKNDVTDTTEPTSPSAATTPTTSLNAQRSPTSSHHHIPHLSHHRSASTHKHRPHLSTTMSNVAASQDSLAPASPGLPAASPISPSITKGASIEQSVKMFRVFESLRNGDTAAISRAIREQSTPADEDLASSQASLASSRTEGTSILHLAIQCAEVPVIEFVLSNAKAGPDAVIDINGRDRDGNTPLHLAATLGRAPVVRLLLDLPGINDSITNYNGQTPLDLARTPDIFQQLQLARSIFIDTNVKKIQQLVTMADMATLEKLLQDPRIKSTLDVNGGDLTTDPVVVENGGTLLHEAAKKKDVKLAQLLLLNGADPFRRDRKGKLPQDYTKDDRTRAILKRSPAAAAAQRGIQEKTILAGASQAGAPADNAGAKESREMKGYLKKWTNYTSGYKLRWFVLEDGVLSYYKHQDDTGSACRGAINMRIGKLYMDPQDKLRFEIQGKSSVKYHLKANHQVEAKRWFWALNNAIQWSKDEARQEEQRTTRDQEALKQAKIELMDKRPSKDGDSVSMTSSRMAPKGQGPSASLSVPSLNYDAPSRPATSVAEDPESTYEPSVGGHDLGKMASNVGTGTVEGDMDDDDDYGDDTSSHEIKPANKDAFNITAQSAKLQLDLLTQVSAALQYERDRNPTLTISDPTMVQALSSYESAVGNLKGLIGDLLRISRDRDAYWQYRLDREANVRRMWEESMAKVAKEQEELENRIGESEHKRKKTKRALREALEEYELGEPGPALNDDHDDFVEAAEEAGQAETEPEPKTPKSSVASQALRRKATFANIAADISDSESEDDEEFFDAVGAGEVEVVEMTVTSPVAELPPSTDDLLADKYAEIATGFKGYEDGPRQKLAMDEDDRPKISLWAILKSMIGKDMTKMTLPVSFNEPTSLLQRVAEDMEYTDLIDTAAERPDSTERLLYIAAFAASEYASTIGRVAKPFNPLLGETYEYARPDKGFRFFIEQVSHHPPIGAAYAESKKWDYYGESAVKSKFYGKSFDINPLGTWFLRLRPSSTGGKEELYTWKKVTSSVIGIITGNPVVDNYGLMEVKNHSTGEVALIDFKPRGWKASSAYQVSGKVLDAGGRVRWSVGGRWNDKIYARLTPGFEDAELDKGGSKHLKQDENKAFLLWECHTRPTGIPFNLTPFVVTLNAIPDALRPLVAPTDTRLRPDQRAMEDGQYDFAATEKNRVEEKQRKTRRIREAKGEDFVPRWFTKGRCETTGEEYWVFSHEYWKVRNQVAEKQVEWKDQGLEDIF